MSVDDPRSSIEAGVEEYERRLAAMRQQLDAALADDTIDNQAIATLTQQLAEARADDATDAATIAELERRVAALTPKPALLLGAHYDTSSLARRGLLDMGLQRSFHPGQPARWATHDASEDVGKRVSWWSTKPPVAATARGENDALIGGFAGDIPATHPCMATTQHEPENPKKRIDPAQWREQQKRTYGIIKSIRPDILVGPILMQGTFLGTQPGRTLDEWGLGADSCDFIGVDTYNPYMMPVFGNKPTWVDFPTRAIVAAQAYADSLGVPLAIGEFGSAEDPADPARKIGYLRQVLDYSTEHNVLGACYFDSVKPGDTAPSISLDSTPAFRDFWNASVAAHPGRTLAAWRAPS